MKSRITFSACPAASIPPGAAILRFRPLHPFLRIIEQEKLVENARGQGARLLEELQNGRETSVHDRRARTRPAAGLRPAQPRNARPFLDGAYELGLLVLRCGERSIRLRPVLDVKDDAIDAALKIIEAECQRLALT
jgi:L-lysine 6-transaminase